MSITLLVNRGQGDLSKLTGKAPDITIEGMSEVQDVLGELKAKGWTIAAVADAIEVHRETVVSWEAGRHQPTTSKLVVGALRDLLRRARVPKKRRYS